MEPPVSTATNVITFYPYDIPFTVDHVTEHPLQHAFEVLNEDETQRFNVSWQLMGNKLHVFINGLTGNIPKVQTIITTRANQAGYNSTWPTLSSTLGEFEHPDMLIAQDENTLLVQINAWGVVRSMFYEDITGQSTRGARVDTREHDQLPVPIDDSSQFDAEIDEDIYYNSQLGLDKITVVDGDVVQLPGTGDIVPESTDAEDINDEGHIILEGCMDSKPKSHKIPYGCAEDGTPVFLALSTDELRHLTETE